MIQIECTEEGEMVSVMGAFSDRLQYCAMALIKALSLVGDKIADSDGAGYSYSEAIKEILPRKTRGLPVALRETTETETASL